MLSSYVVCSQHPTSMQPLVPLSAEMAAIAVKVQKEKLDIGWHVSHGASRIRNTYCYKGSSGSAQQRLYNLHQPVLKHSAV